MRNLVINNVYISTKIYDKITHKFIIYQ